MTFIYIWGSKTGERLKEKRRGKDAETGRKPLFRLFSQEGKEYSCL